MSETVELHHPEARVRMAWPEDRGRCRDYGRGRTCADKHCGNVLSRYNAGPFCHGCEVRRIHEEAKVKSKPGFDMERVLALLREHEDAAIGRDDIATSLALTPRAVAQHIWRLRRDGRDIEFYDIAGKPHYIYAAGQDVSKTASQPPAAPAPELKREQPVGAAADSAPGTPQGPPRAAGEELQDAVRELYYAAHWTADRPCDEEQLWTAVRDAAGLEQGKAPRPLLTPCAVTADPREAPMWASFRVYGNDPELDTLGICTSALCDVSEEACRRIVAYFFDRYGVAGEGQQ